MSDGSNSLNRLALERENILLAEIAVWFHDWQKCIPLWKQLGVKFNPDDIASELEKHKPPIPGSSIGSLSFKEIVEQGRNPSQAKHSTDWRIRLLGACHDNAHFDKPESQQLGRPSNLISTAFGFETLPNAITSLKKLKTSAQHLTDRVQCLAHLKEAFIHALGDTRRPINEVTLWDWGGATAALWKAVAAQIVLESLNQEPDQPKWRMLSIQFDGLHFLERAPTISDLIGRRSALHAALDRVRHLLEVEYPLGNEVYRDENGSVFVVPALTGDYAEGNRLRGLVERLILDRLRNSELEGELRPAIYITQEDKQAAVLHKALEIPPPPVAPFQDSLACWWRGEPADICTACGVRPQGWGAPNHSQKQKAQQRNVCYVCLQRRGRRAQLWAQARNKTKPEERIPWEQTIWLDEIADENGRLALIVGKFDLSQWLNGKLIRTLLVVCDPDNNTYESKNPSFARIQRVWRTTEAFWQTVASEDIPAVVQPRQNRLAIAVDNTDELQQHLGDYHAYEAEVNGRQLAVVWDSEAKVLLTAENLLWWGHDTQAVLTSLPDQLSLFEPGGYGQRRGLLCHARIDRNRSQIFRDAYVPAMTLLTEPNAFMALVPATAALEIATKIKHRYELEMSKVSNRLPLFLGVVFLDQRQPLFSALDAGRRLLKASFSSKKCKVIHSRTCTHQNGNSLPPYLHHNHFREWQEIMLETSGGECLQWRVSTVMGDGSTPDDWYTFVQVVRDQTGNRPTNREKIFEHPEQHGEYWAHVKTLNEGDTILFTPSLFTWMYLDTSARRFEAGERVQHLEELERITSTWQKLKELAANKQLSESQLHAIVALLATKEDAWGRNANTFRQLAEAILHKEGLETLTIEDLISGRLVNTFDIYHRILKQKLSKRRKPMSQPAETKRYYAIALDPIHVGTGGYRLGRVDNSIVREPGSNLPKIPGTSFSGACRAYAAMVTGKYPQCAGQGQNRTGHCGQYTCPVCVSFGFARDRSGFQGLAQFADVGILFFPVHSLVGPVWVTCPGVLKDAGLPVDSQPPDDQIRLGNGLSVPNNRLNLGWLMLPVEKNGDFTLQPNSLPQEIQNTILHRSVLVPDKLFAQIVNDNLEVRTSVSINPETGAAEEGALFTYEAIPRSTVFWFPITYLNSEFFKINGQQPSPEINRQRTTVKKVVEKGLVQFEHLGIGGMNTRGMGRLRVFIQPQDENSEVSHDESR